MLVYLAGISVFGAVGFYLMFVYIVSWLQFADGIAPAQALTINTISMALLIPAEVGMAGLSDRVGRRPMLIAVTGLAVAAAGPLFWLMHGHEQWMILAGQLGFVVLVGGYYGCLPAFMVEAVPKEVRCTAIALGYNVSLGLIGGLSPLAATWLVHRTDDDYSPAFMIMAAAAISFLVLLLGRPRVSSPLPPVTGIQSIRSRSWHRRTVMLVAPTRAPLPPLLAVLLPVPPAPPPSSFPPRFAHRSSSSRPLPRLPPRRLPRLRRLARARVRAALPPSPPSPRRSLAPLSLPLPPSPAFPSPSVARAPAPSRASLAARPPPPRPPPARSFSRSLPLRSSLPRSRALSSVAPPR